MPFHLRIALATIGFWAAVCIGFALLALAIRRLLGCLFAWPWQDERP